MSIFKRSHRRSSSSGDVFDLSALQISKESQIPPNSANPEPSAVPASLKPSSRTVLSRFSISAKPSPSQFKSTQSQRDVSKSGMASEALDNREDKAPGTNLAMLASTSSNRSPWYSLGWKNLQQKTSKASPSGRRSRKGSPALNIPVVNPVAPWGRNEEVNHHSRVRSDGDLYDDFRQPVNVLNQPFSDITEKYDIGPELGTGTFGVVRKCWDRQSGASLAVKTVMKSGLNFESDFEDLRSEVKTLTAVGSHPHVVHLEAVFEDEKSVHLVMELCQGGDLFHRIRERKRFPEASAARVTLALAEAVRHCWAQGVMHRDLKPENILLGSALCDWDVRVADFGKACFALPGERKREVVGTPFYLPPEVLSGSYGREADMWCVGVVLFILLCGRPPFWARDKDEIFDLIEKGDFDCRSGVWAQISEGAKDLVRSMLCRDASCRIRPEQVKDHPWILQHCVAEDSDLEAVIAPPVSSPPGSDLYKPLPVPQTPRRLYRPMTKELGNFPEPSSSKQQATSSAPGHSPRPSSTSSSSGGSAPGSRHRRSPSVSPTGNPHPHISAISSFNPSLGSSPSPSPSNSPEATPNPNPSNGKGPFMPPKSPSQKGAGTSGRRRHGSKYSSFSAPHSPSEVAQMPSKGDAKYRTVQSVQKGGQVSAEDLSVDELLVLLMQKLEKEKERNGGMVEGGNPVQFLSDISQRLDRIGGARSQPS